MSEGVLDQRHSQRIVDEFSWTQQEMRRPCVVFKAKVHQENGGYIATCGDALAVLGVMAFGKTPAEAMLNFDKVWEGRPSCTP